MAKIIRIRTIQELVCSPTTPRAIMGIFAHPDDESLLMGGMLALAHGEGVHTFLVTATRGELGGKSSGIYGKKLAVIRSRELIDAARILNIDSLHHMEIPDKGVHTHQRKITQALVDIFNRNKPQIIVTHDRSDPSQHSDHISTSQAVIDAITQINPPWVHMVLFAALKPNVTSLTYMLDIENFSKIKTQACRAHASQELFSYIRLAPDIYYAVNHFEYFIPYEKEKTADDKRHHSDKK